MNIPYCQKRNKSIDTKKFLCWCITAGHKLAMCKHLAIIRKGKMIEIKKLLSVKKV